MMAYDIWYIYIYRNYFKVHIYIYIDVEIRTALDFLQCILAFFVISPPGVYHNTEVVAFANSRYVNKLKAEGSPQKIGRLHVFFNGKYCAKEVWGRQKVGSYSSNGSISEL